MLRCHIQLFTKLRQLYTTDITNFSPPNKINIYIDEVKSSLLVGSRDDVHYCYIVNNRAQNVEPIFIFLYNYINKVIQIFVIRRILSYPCFILKNDTIVGIVDSILVCL